MLERAQASPTSELQLAQDMGRLAWYPEKWQLYSFPWGQPGTFLERHEAPRAWQADLFAEIGEAIRKNQFDGANPVDPIEAAVSSGHGIGKSAETAMLILFLMSTRPNAKGTVTATTVPQLRTKTWSELGKWLGVFIARHWFKYTASQSSLSLSRIGYDKTWRCDGITSKEENSESFAGQHASDGSSFYIFDEASGVPDKIFEVSDGGLTDGEPFRFFFGNSTKPTGRFRTAFGRDRNRYITRQIDSRTVEGTNKKYLDGLVERFGEDSDYIRVRVRGLPPRASSIQFMPSDLVEAARVRPAVSYPHQALVVFCDVARFGDDSTIIGFRRGFDARSIPWVALHHRDTMVIAGILAEIMTGSHYTNGQIPDALFVDGAGVGGGVVDRLNQLNIDVIECNGAFASPDPRYANQRAYGWGRMRDAMPKLSIPDDQETEDDLVGLEYGLNREGKFLLESKKDMKKRGLASPDRADALSLSYVQDVLPSAQGGDGGNQMMRDHDPLDD